MSTQQPKTDTDAEVTALKQKLEREKDARAAAEHLLEVKSKELYDSRTALENTIEERTRILHDRLDEVETLRNQLERERDEALRESAAKTLMFAKLSHEIRTPLNGVVGAINFIGDSQIDEDTQYWVGVASNSMRALKNILTNAIDLARLEQGVITLEEGSFHIMQLLSDIRDFWTPQLLPGQQIELDIQPEAALKYSGDPGRIRQIIDNFTSNAIKYGGRGTITLQAEVLKAKKDHQEIRIAVSDQGETLPVQKQNSLFNPFDRGGLGYEEDDDTAGPEEEIGQGVGLGLTICRELADLMQAQLGIIPVLPHGNSFFMDIKLQILASDGDSDSAGTPISDAGTGAETPLIDRRTTRRTILIVEDVPTNQMVLERYLDGYGYAHETAEHGQEALEMIERRGDRPYDMILMDIAMPVMDGFEATRRIKALKGPAADVPIIGVSAHVGKGEAQTMKDVGMIEALEKPIDRDVLAQVIQRELPQVQSISDNPRHNRRRDDDVKLNLDAMPDWMDEELLEQVRTDITDSVQQAEDGIAANDIETVKNAYHKLKGILGTFEMPRYKEVRSLYEDIHNGRAPIDVVKKHDIMIYLKKLTESL